MPGQCIVYKCSNDGNFHFPKEPKAKKAWIKAVNRKNWAPSRYSRICVGHFKEDDFVKENENGYSSLRKNLKIGAIPSIFKYKQKKQDAKSICNRKNLRNKLAAIRTIEGENTISTSIFDVTTVEIPSAEPDVSHHNERSISVPIQTELPLFPSKLSIEELKHNPKMLHFFSGLQTYENFMTVFSTLNLSNLVYRHRECIKLSQLNQFLLTMIRFRRYRPVFDLAFLFGVSEYTVSNILTSWINFMYNEWSQINIWPSKTLVSFYMPKDFKKKFPATRVILDAFEGPIQRPKNPLIQQATASSYKNRNTVKVVVVVTPGGLVSYISPVYGGATSDREIIERSPLTSLCEAGDSVMADKGFDVQDIFAPYNIAVNIPTFLKGLNKLSGLTVKRARRISSKRIHVERLIGLGKTFRLLKHPLCHSDTANANKLIFLCMFLCNFRSCIVSKDA